MVALDAPLRPAGQPISRPGGRVDCSNPNCYTRSRQRTQGNRNCIGYFCGPCCKDAKLAAINSNAARPKCAVHKQDSATPTVLGLQPIAAYQPGPPVDTRFAPPLANLPGPAYPSDPAPANHPYQPPVFPPNPAAQHRNIDPMLVLAQPTHHAPVTSNQARHRSLAQPMGHNWVQKHQDAVQEDTLQKSLKTQRQENDEKKKRTCDVRIWFEVSLSITHIDQVLTQLYRMDESRSI